MSTCSRQRLRLSGEVKVKPEIVSEGKRSAPGLMSQRGCMSAPVASLSSAMVGPCLIAAHHPAVRTTAMSHTRTRTTLILFTLFPFQRSRLNIAHCHYQPLSEMASSVIVPEVRGAPPEVVAKGYIELLRRHASRPRVSECRPTPASPRGRPWGYD